ncbi:hypothetical protein SLS60_007961 [Paraconiothyrium brasiliense]|uniref:C3H1-type domain-containing protein n=1 Tax=Paraconiothyrium brasiliense TaxID=300254 RepID=A0ABR3R303_9PLEO
MATPQSPSSTRLDPRIRYYILRKHGNTIVPLIPADQLPFHLKDFPKNLTHRDLSQGGWKYLEDTSEIPFPLALLSPDVQMFFERKAEQNVHSAAMPVEETFMEQVYTKEVTAKGTPPTDVSIYEASAQKVPTKHTTREAVRNARKPTTIIIPNHPIHSKTNSLTDSMAAIYTRDAHRVGYTKHSSTVKRTVAARGKETCRHWAKNGACKWTTTEEGCRYKHELPPLGKLKKMAISELPGCFREKDRYSNGFTRNKAGPHTVPEACGTYTTNTADEPMLMDMGVDMSDMILVQDNIRIAPVAQAMSTHLQTPCTVAESSKTARNPGLAPTSTSAKPVSPLPVASPRTKTSKPTKTRLRSSSTFARLNSATRQGHQSTQTKKMEATHATKRPTLRVADEDKDSNANPAISSLKRKSSPNRGCNVRVRQPDLIPCKKTGLVVNEKAKIGKTSSGFGSSVSAAVGEGV